MGQINFEIETSETILQNHKINKLKEDVTAVVTRFKITILVKWYYFITKLLVINTSYLQYYI